MQTNLLPPLNLLLPLSLSTTTCILLLTQTTRSLQRALWILKITDSATENLNPWITSSHNLQGTHPYLSKDLKLVCSENVHGKLCLSLGGSALWNLHVYQFLENLMHQSPSGSLWCNAVVGNMFYFGIWFEKLHFLWEKVIIHKLQCSQVCVGVACEPGWQGNVINTSPPSATYMRQWIQSALVHKMACRLFSAKPLSELMLGHCQLNNEEQTSVKF